MDAGLSEGPIIRLCERPARKGLIKRGITVGTARNVLKTVFRKAEVNRQTQLALKISNLGRVALTALGDSGGFDHYQALAGGERADDRL